MNKFMYVFDEEARDLLIEAGLKQLPCTMKTDGENVFLFVLEGDILDDIMSDCTYMLSDSIVL